MGAQAVAGPLDLDDDGVVQEAIEERGSDDGIAEDLAPFGEAAVRREDHRAFLIAGIDQLEEQVGAAAGDGQVADLVDDQQRSAGVEADLVAEPTLALGLGQRLDQLGQARPVDRPPGLYRGDTEGGRDVGFAGAWRTEEVHDLGAPDEADPCVDFHPELTRVFHREVTHLEIMLRWSRLGQDMAALLLAAGRGGIRLGLARKKWRANSSNLIGV